MDENFVFIQVKKVEEKLDTHIRSDSPITYGTQDLTAGTSALETGKIYLVYE